MIAWGMLLVSLVTAVILVLHLYTFRESNDTARLSNQAYVYFGDPGITPYPYPPNDPTHWGLSINISNNGNLPAHKVDVWFACPVRDKSENITDPFQLAKWEKGTVGSTIGAKQTIMAQGCGIPIEDINDAKKGEKLIFYVVRAKYTDGFDDKVLRKTEMSRIFKFDNFGGRSLGIAGPHNCMDDDCPE